MKRFLSILVVLCALVPGTAWSLEVNEVRLGIHPDKVRLVFELSSQVPYRVSMSADPYRLVIDTPQAAWQAGSIETPPQAAIADIRHGDLEGRFSRTVVDLKTPFTVKSVFFLPADKGYPNRLVVDYRKDSESAFLAQKDRSFGKLDLTPAMARATTPPPPPAAVTPPSPAPQPFALQIPRPGRKPAGESDFKAPPVPERTVKVITPETEEASTIAAVTSGIIVPDKKPVVPVYEKPLIVIDPGHGGIDPGATGANGLFEKNVTLAMARTLKGELEATGRYEVTLTRTTDKYLRLHQRIEIARQRGGDLFISLHADSIGKSNVRGASIYTLSEKASDEQTERLAMRENRADLIAGVDLSSEDELVANILVDLAMRDTMNQSQFFANTVVHSLGQRGISLLDNPHRYAGFAVLKSPDIPSILIEMGFISNRTEAKMLADPNFQNRLAKALAGSIDAYFQKIRENNRT